MSGDRTFKKVSVSIDAATINDSWHSINIYQTLDAMSWSCDIGIIDGTNMLEELPIQHGSELKINIVTEDQCSTDDDVEFIFYIYKVADKQSQNQNMETYKLHGVSKPFLLNNTVRINEKYKTQKVSDVVKDISTKAFPDMRVNLASESDNSNDLLINNWSPFISIAWLMKQAHKDGRADFMFYQSDHDELTLETLESMYSDSKNEISETVTYKIENLTGDHNHYNIIKHQWDHVDVQQNLQNGYYKSTVTAFDFMNKSWSESVYSHGDDNKEDAKIAPQWKDSLFGNAEKSAISFIPKNPALYDGENMYNDADKWLPSRRAILQRLDSEKFTAQMRGSVGTYKWLGKHILIEMPSNNETKGEFYSNFRRGYYLITAVMHHITPTMYVNNYEFVKMRIESDGESEGDNNGKK